jgi:hypothetical protein
MPKFDKSFKYINYFHLKSASRIDRDDGLLEGLGSLLWKATVPRRRRWGSGVSDAGPERALPVRQRLLLSAVASSRYVTTWWLRQRPYQSSAIQALASLPLILAMYVGKYVPLREERRS